MRKIHLSLLLSIVAFFATGCPSEPSKDFNNKNSLVSKITVNDVNTALKAYQTNYNQVVKTDAVEAKRQRDDALELAIASIDDNYTDFIRKVQTRRATSDFIADLIDLSTGAVIGITKGERPNQILGIALTAFRGGRRSADLNFYMQQTAPILINKMDDNRAQVLAGIIRKKELDVSQYSMTAAIRDIVAYYNAGTLVRAFTQLSKDTADQAKDSEQVVKILRGEDVTISDIPTVEREKRSTSIFLQRRSLAQQLADAKRTADADAKAEKIKAVRDKLEAIWKDVEAQDKFTPFIAEMRDDPRFVDILAKTPDDLDQVTEDEFLRLINGLTAKIKMDEEASNLLLEILTRANK